MPRWALVGTMVLAAAAVGGLAGWLAPWAASALTAVVIALLVAGVFCLSTQITELRRRDVAARERQDRIVEFQERIIEAQQRTRMEVSGARADVKDATKAVTKAVKAARKSAANDSRARDDALFQQFEALQNLHQIIQVRRAVSPSRGWAASPDLLLTYVEEILANKPGCIVECGSGLSTVWAAYALQSVGSAGKVVALEHELEFAERTRTQLAEHGLADYGEVRHAPLTEVNIAGETWRWYDPTALRDMPEIDLVLIDGPPKATGDQARYPALPVLREHLARGAVMLADDAARKDESAIVHRWLEEWPELTHESLRHEKGTVRLQVPGEH